MTSVLGARGRHRRRRPFWVLPLMVLLVAGVGVASYWWFTRTPPGGGAREEGTRPAGPVVAEFEGRGDQATDPFTVEDGWTMRWTHSGDTFSITVAGEPGLGMIVNRGAPGSGSTDPLQGGTFHLEIEARGSWGVQVTEGDGSTQTPSPLGDE